MFNSAMSDGNNTKYTIYDGYKLKQVRQRVFNIPMWCIRVINSCCVKAAIQSVVIVELYVTVSNVKISSVARQCFYGEFMLPSTI